MTSLRAGFAEGVRTILPLVPAAGTVALAAGVAAPTAGLTPTLAVAMSVVVYFPSVMLAALGLLAAGVPTVVVVLTALVVGVRLVVLSLSVAPYVRRLSTGWKLTLAYLLWTPVYAFVVERFADDPDGDVRGYYLGLALPLWVTVQGLVLVGATFGAAVPPGLNLEFVVPLAFLALVRRFVTDRATAAAAVAGATLAVGGAGLPFGLGVVVATVGGTVAGVAVSGVRAA